MTLLESLNESGQFAEIRTKIGETNLEILISHAGNLLKHAPKDQAAKFQESIINGKLYTDNEGLGELSRHFLNPTLFTKLDVFEKREDIKCLDIVLYLALISNDVFKTNFVYENFVGESIASRFHCTNDVSIFDNNQYTIKAAASLNPKSQNEQQTTAIDFSDEEKELAKIKEALSLHQKQIELESAERTGGAYGPKHFKKQLSKTIELQVNIAMLERTIALKKYGEFDFMKAHYEAQKRVLDGANSKLKELEVKMQENGNSKMEVDEANNDTDEAIETSDDEAPKAVVGLAEHKQKKAPYPNSTIPKEDMRNLFKTLNQEETGQGPNGLFPSDSVFTGVVNDDLDDVTPHEDIYQKAQPNDKNKYFIDDAALKEIEEDDLGKAILDSQKENYDPELQRILEMSRRDAEKQPSKIDDDFDSDLQEAIAMSMEGIPPQEDDEVLSIGSSTDMTPEVLDVSFGQL